MQKPFQNDQPERNNAKGGKTAELIGRETKADDHEGDPATSRQDDTNASAPVREPVQHCDTHKHMFKLGNLQTTAVDRDNVCATGARFDDKSV